MSTGPNTSNLVDIDKEKAIFFMKRANLYAKQIREQVSEDPWPLIQNLQEENYELNQLLAEINLLVNPIYLDWASDEPIKVDDLKPDANERLLTVREVLESWVRA